MKIIRPLIVTDTGTFTRSTTGTYFDLNGIMQTAAINTPRFSTNPANLSAGALLLNEAAATNLMEYSEAINTAPWVTINTTITANAIASPNSLVTAGLVTEGSTTNFFGIQQQLASNPSIGTYTYSGFVKANGRTQIQLKFGSSTDTFAMNYDMVALTATPATGSPTGTIKALPNNWFQLTFTFTTTASLVSTMYHYMMSGGASPYTGNGSSGMYMWGWQLESGAVNTSYFATTSAPATRGAETNTQMFTTNIPEMDYPEWSSGTTYAQGAFVIVTLTGGAPHYVYQSLVASNLNNPPATSSSQWVRVTADNRWRLFDAVVTDQTVQNGGFSLALTPNARFDSVTGLNCNANSVIINMVDPTYGLVYSQTVQLTSFSGITDWYAYFYEPIVQQVDFNTTALPATYSAATIHITVTGPTAAMGELVVGLSKELGYSEWGAKAAIIDYSVKTQDSFGNYQITKRNFSKRLDITVQIPTNTIDSVQTLLATYRTTPIVYVGSNVQDAIPGYPTPAVFNSTLIYGYYKDFSLEITYNAFGVCTFQIEGLT